MKKVNLILEQWKKEQDHFNLNLAILKKRLNPGAVHEIRVSIKKLRAYKKLYFLLKENTNAVIQLEETEKLFDILGRQRNIQVCLHLLAGYEMENNCRYNELKQFLKSKLKKSRTWSKQAVAGYKINELTKFEKLLKNDKDLIEQEPLEIRIQQVINSDFNDLTNHFSQPHKVRILLKKIYNWVTVLPREPSEQLYHPEEMNRILDELGEWQDNEILITETKHFRKDFLPEPFAETELLKEFEKLLGEKKKQLQQTAFKQVKQWKKLLKVK